MLIPAVNLGFLTWVLLEPELVIQGTATHLCCLQFSTPEVETHNKKKQYWRAGDCTAALSMRQGIMTD